MAHLAAKQSYVDLQKRLDKMPVGAPPRKELFDLLQELFTDEECKIAAAMPFSLASARTIAAAAGVDTKRAEQVLTTLAQKGLVVDIPREGRSTYYFLNPTVIGFFEFTMMRVRNNLDQKKIAKLMWAYIKEDPTQAFISQISGGQTFMARPMVHEDVLSDEVYAEVLDYEKATKMVEEGRRWAVGLCHCRHVKEHLGKPCSYPMDVCLSFGQGADYLIRNNISREIGKSEALDILTQCRELGLVQMGDNVKRNATFICNCCKCCCEMMLGLRTVPDGAKVVTSNYMACADEDVCNGCGKCAKACPIDAIEMVPAEPTDKAKKRKKMAVVDAERCLGCGVCHRACNFESISLSPIGVRTYTPESLMEKLILQAVERGKLQHYLFADHTKVSHRAMSSFIGAIINLPPAKRLLARDQIKSAFVDRLLSMMRHNKSGREALKV